MLQANGKNMPLGKLMHDNVNNIAAQIAPF